MEAGAQGRLHCPMGPSWSTPCLVCLFTFSILSPYLRISFPGGPFGNELPAPEASPEGLLLGDFSKQFPNFSVYIGTLPPGFPPPWGGLGKPPCWLRSSTRMISFRKALGAVSRMLCMVLRRMDQGSSWKQRMMLAVGRLSSGCCCRHLQG